MFRSLPLLLIAAWLAPAALLRGVPAEYTNALEILKLPPQQASAQHRASVKGVVTCYVPSSQLCFVQDHSGGVYVYPSPWPDSLEPGMIVEVEGVTGAGRFSSIIQWARITPTGETGSVTPRQISIEDLNSGAYDSQLIEIEGVVQSLVRGGDVWKLEVVTGGSSASILLFNDSPVPANWVDSRVRVRGVAGTYYSGEELTGFGLFLERLEDFQVTRPAPDPFTEPLRPAGKLPWFGADRELNHRIRVRGVVTLDWPGDSFFVQDQSGSVRISISKGGSNPAPGTIVEVSGFLRDLFKPTRYLAGAEWRALGTAALPVPRSASLDDLAAWQPVGTSVSVDGRVAAVGSQGGITKLLLEEDGTILPAYLQEPLPENLRGAIVRVTGAWSMAPDALKNSGRPGIWLAGTNHLAVLERPKPDAPAFASTTPLWPLAMGLAGLLVGGVLAGLGHARKRAATSAGNSKSAQLDMLAAELAQVKEGRERLGRDLHDHIIQSIYAVGLKLEDSRHLLGNSGQLEPRITSALSDINSVIRELRNVIHGLESSTIQPQEFRTAVKSLGLTAGDEKSHRLRLEIPPAAADLLSPAQATELIHIAREAMSNSVRHGRAQTTTFRLEAHPPTLTFSIEDDGRGFDPSVQQPNGYGLRNMARRAESIGATFTIQSQPGSGTCVSLKIPIQNFPSR